MVELLFGKSGDAARLLLFAQTATVFRDFHALLHMHAGRFFALVLIQHAGVVALLTFQKEFRAFSAAQTADRSNISRHTTLSSVWVGGTHHAGSASRPEWTE